MSDPLHINIVSCVCNSVYNLISLSSDQCNASLSSVGYWLYSMLQLKEHVMWTCFAPFLSIPWSTFRVQPSLCRTNSGSVFLDSLWTPKVLCSHFLQARGKLKHLSLSRGEAKKSLSLTARATEQEKALAWPVSDALPGHDEIYRERGWQMARKYVCGCACVAVFFFLTRKESNCDC